jgi:hypothetical protein
MEGKISICLNVTRLLINWEFDQAYHQTKCIIFSYRNCQSQMPTQCSHKNSSLVYVIKFPSFVYLDGTVSSAPYASAVRSRLVPFLTKFVTDMSTASYQQGGANPPSRNYVLEFDQTDFEERNFYFLS